MIVPGPKPFPHPCLLNPLFVPYLHDTSKTPREYQLTIADRAAHEHLLVVIPTGLGKTYIATLTMLHFFTTPAHANSTIIFLAPTRPLIEQHYQSHLSLLDTSKIAIEQLTGTIKPAKRQQIFQLPTAKILFMTPQTLRNDLDKRLYSLNHTSLIIFDEAHRAAGEYAYCPIATHYHTMNSEGRILALTASPGSTEKKRLEIMANLHIPSQNIEHRDITHVEVQSYAFAKEEVEIGVAMTPFMIQIRNELLQLKEHTTAGYMELLTQYDPQAPTNPNLYHLGFCATKMKGLAASLKSDPDHSRELRILLSTNARLMKILRLLNDLESQGLEVVHATLTKMYAKLQKGKASFADKFLSADPRINGIFQALELEQFQMFKASISLPVSQ